MRSIALKSGSTRRWGIFSPIYLSYPVTCQCQRPRPGSRNHRWRKTYDLAVVVTKKWTCGPNSSTFQFIPSLFRRQHQSTGTFWRRTIWYRWQWRSWLWSRKTRTWWAANNGTSCWPFPQRIRIRKILTGMFPFIEILMTRHMSAESFVQITKDKVPWAIVDVLSCNVGYGQFDTRKIQLSKSLFSA